MKKIIILFIFTMLACLIAEVKAQHRFEIKTPWPDSMHANHVDHNGDPNENNGGSGWFVKYKNLDKGGIDVGIGQIWFINSFGDPGRVDIVQLADAEAEFNFFKLGVAVWKMDIYGYYSCYEKGCNRDEIVHNIDVWPIPHIEFNPAYYWTENFWIDFRYVNFITVSITFVMVGYRMEF